MHSEPGVWRLVKAVLFDLDGTLVHSSLDFPRIRREISCPEGIDLLRYVASLEGADKKHAEQIIHRHELEDAHSAHLIEGVPELLSRLEHAGVKTGIITRNSAEATRIKLETCELEIAHVITREDAPPKPDPGALLHLSTRFGLEPSSCVYVGDYLYDLKAANSAGMHACLFYPSKNAFPEYVQLADFICDDFDRFEIVLKAYLLSEIK